jgi:hypothetical protein
VESPSARPWLGVGAALSALPAAGGCYCAALVVALVTGSDPGAVHEQHRWLGAVVAAGAVCAFVAMMGWATLRHGGVPAPVLLMGLALAGVPFLLPGGLFLPAAVVAVAGCAALLTAGLARPPEYPEGAEAVTGWLARSAIVLTVGYVVLVVLTGAAGPRAEVRGFVPPPEAAEPEESFFTPERPAKRSRPRRAERSRRAPAKPRPAKPAPAEPTPATPAPAKPAPATPAPAKPAPAGSGGTAPAPAPAGPAPAGAARFVRSYYAALDSRRFASAWRMLTSPVQAAFGGFATWRKGFSRTVSSTPGAIRVTAAGGGATVGLTLRAGDRGACGKTVERRFAVTWRLVRTEAGWRAAAASARKLGGPEPC